MDPLTDAFQAKEGCPEHDKCMCECHLEDGVLHNESCCSTCAKCGMENVLDPQRASEEQKEEKSIEFDSFEPPVKKRSAPFKPNAQYDLKRDILQALWRESDHYAEFVNGQLA